MARALRREGRGWPAEWEKRGSHPGTQAWSPPLQPPIPSLTALDTAKASFAVLTSTHQGPGRAPGSRRKQEGPYRSFYSPVGPMLAFGSPGVKAVGGREHGQGPSLRADKPALRQGDWTQAWGSSHTMHTVPCTQVCVGGGAGACSAASNLLSEGSNGGQGHVHAAAQRRPVPPDALCSQTVAPLHLTTRAQGCPHQAGSSLKAEAKFPSSGR